MRSLRRPLHVLLLDHALTNHLVNGRFSETSADPIAVAIPLPVVDNLADVVADVGLKFLDVLQHAYRRFAAALPLGLAFLIVVAAVQILRQPAQLLLCIAYILPVIHIEFDK